LWKDRLQWQRIHRRIAGRGCDLNGRRILLREPPAIGILRSSPRRAKSKLQQANDRQNSERCPTGPVPPIPTTVLVIAAAASCQVPVHSHPITVTGEMGEIMRALGVEFNSLRGGIVLLTSRSLLYRLRWNAGVNRPGLQIASGHRAQAEHRAVTQVHSRGNGGPGAHP
jgi:hypothetical protein